MIYINCLQFECEGDVAIYDSQTMTETIYPYKGLEGKDSTVKDVEWYGEDSVLCIIGYRYGTVSQGGLVYQLDLVSGNITRAISSDVLDALTDRPYEVVDVKIEESGLYIKMIEWEDDNYDDYYYTDHVIPWDKTTL